MHRNSIILIIFQTSLRHLQIRPTCLTPPEPFLHLHALSHFNLCLKVSGPGHVPVLPDLGGAQHVPHSSIMKTEAAVALHQTLLMSWNPTQNRI